MKTADFAAHLTEFLSHYLPELKNISTNTISSYCDAFRLFLGYCQDVEGMRIEKLSIDDLTPELVDHFLQWLRIAASSALIPAKNVLTQDGTSPFGTIPTRASMLIPKEREKCATVSSFGLVFPRSKSEMLRSVVPSFSASSTCVRPSSCRALFRATPKRLQISCIPSPFLLFSF